MPGHDADGDLFRQPGMLISLGSGGAIGRFALGADVVEIVSHGALSVRLANKTGAKKGSAFAKPFLKFGGYAGT